MFVQMLKSMREALQDGLFSSDRARHSYASMYDQQIAQR